MATKKIKGTYDRSIKVSEAQIQKLRDAKTRDAAIKKYGSDPAMQEALNRFYSKSVVTAKKKQMGITTGSANPVGSGTGSRPSGGVTKKASSPVKSSPTKSTAKPTSSKSTAKKPGVVNGKSALSGALSSTRSPMATGNIGNQMSAVTTPAMKKNQEAKLASLSQRDKILIAAVQMAVPTGGLGAIFKGLKGAKAVAGAAKAQKALPAGKVVRGALGPAAPKALPVGPVGRSQMAKAAIKTLTASERKQAERLALGVKKGTATRGELTEARAALIRAEKAAKALGKAKRPVATPAKKAMPTMNKGAARLVTGETKAYKASKSAKQLAVKSPSKPIKITSAKPGKSASSPLSASAKNAAKIAGRATFGATKKVAKTAVKTKPRKIAVGYGAYAVTSNEYKKRNKK